MTKKELKKLSKKIPITFYKPNRMWSDSLDTYHWLNSLNLDMAEEFKRKMKFAENWFTEERESFWENN